MPGEVVAGILTALIGATFAFARYMAELSDKRAAEVQAVLREQMELERKDNRSARDRQWQEQSKLLNLYKAEAESRINQYSELIASMWQLRQSMKVGFSQFVKAQEIWERIDTHVQALPEKVKQNVDDTMTGTSDLLLREFQKLNRQMDGINRNVNVLNERHIVEIQNLIRKMTENCDKIDKKIVEMIQDGNSQKDT